MIRQAIRSMAALALAVVATAAAGAEPADIRILAPYIGKFRSAAQRFDDGKTEYYYTIEYRWFDRPQTIVQFTVATVIPSQDRVIVNAEGFYGFDPFHDQLYVFAAFAHGVSGWGSICEANPETGARTVCARSMSDGVVTEVRDGFEMLDADRWRNRTLVRTDGQAEWTLAHEAVYTRVAAAP